jgi:hypothetical protein
MKKFSNITGQKIGEAPKTEDVKINEEDLFKSKVLNLMDQLLSIRTYGPVDRYQRAGNIKIAGKEMFLEALMDLLNSKSLKDQAKLLENLKVDIKDWNVIDSKIEDINNKILNTNENTKLLSHKNKLNTLYKNYKDDESMMMQMVDVMIEKITNPECAHLRAITADSMSNSGKYPKEIFNKISEKLHKRAQQLGYSK